MVRSAISILVFIALIWIVSFSNQGLLKLTGVLFVLAVVVFVFFLIRQHNNRILQRLIVIHITLALSAVTIFCSQAAVYIEFQRGLGERSARLTPLLDPESTDSRTARECPLQYIDAYYLEKCTVLLVEDDAYRQIFFIEGFDGMSVRGFMYRADSQAPTKCYEYPLLLREYQQINEHWYWLECRHALWW